MRSAEPKNPPRILSKADAAAYCGMSVTDFHQLVVAKTLPDRVYATWGWDRAAIDLAIDRLSGIDRSAPPAKPSGLAAYMEKWHARKAAEAEQRAKDEAAGIKPERRRRQPTRKGRPVRDGTPEA